MILWILVAFALLNVSSDATNTVYQIKARPLELCEFVISGTTLTVTGNGDADVDYCPTANKSLITKIVISPGVITIGNEFWFAGEALTELEISSTVETIGHKAFRDCSKLQSVTGGDHVSFIGSYAFAWTSVLSFSFPAVQSIDKEAFRGTSLSSVHLPAVTSQVGEWVFLLCPLHTLTVANENPWLTVFDGALYDKQLLTLILVPGKLMQTELVTPAATTTVADSACTWQETLQRIELTNVVEIGWFAFSTAYQVVEFFLPPTLLEIGQRAFADMHSLLAIDIPSSVTHIPDCCLLWCTSIRTLELPDSILTCGAGFVQWCTDLAEIWLGNSVISVGYDAFAQNVALSEIFFPDSLEILDTHVFWLSSLTSISLPGSVSTVDTLLFQYESSLDPSTNPLQTLHLRGPVSPAVCAALANLPPGVAVFTSGVSGNTICSDVEVVHENTRTPRATSRVLPTPSRAKSRSPTQSQSIRPTLRPDVTPQEITVAESEPVDPDSLDLTRPISIRGNGTLQGTTGEVLWLNAVTIQPQAQVIARNVGIQASLCLESGSSLRAAPQGQIILVPDLELEFRGPDVDQLPYLDLGDIGATYDVIPSVLNIVIESESFSGDVNRFLVQGKTLSNCLEWHSKVTGLSSGCEMQCKPMPNSDQSLLAGEEVIGLFIVKSGDSAVEDTVSAAVMAGTFVAIVVVVIGIVVVAIWWAYLRKVDGDRIYAEPSPPLESTR
jgi:hypothetical protein